MSSGSTTGIGGVSTRRYPRMIPRSLGSSLPVRSCACTASASSSAVTVTSTTTSVSISACTTGSTAGVPGGISAKTGARRAHAIADAQQQHVGGGLHHGQADDQVHQVAGW